MDLHHLGHGQLAQGTRLDQALGQAVAIHHQHAVTGPKTRGRAHRHHPTLSRWCHIELARLTSTAGIDFSTDLAQGVAQHLQGLHAHELLRSVFHRGRGQVNPRLPHGCGAIGAAKRHVHTPSRHAKTIGAQHQVQTPWGLALALAAQNDAHIRRSRRIGRHRANLGLVPVPALAVAGLLAPPVRRLLSQPSADMGVATFERRVQGHHHVNRHAPTTRRLQTGLGIALDGGPMRGRFTHGGGAQLGRGFSLGRVGHDPNPTHLGLGMELCGLVQGTFVVHPSGVVDLHRRLADRLHQSQANGL